jgi:hypothetical protein
LDARHYPPRDEEERQTFPGLRDFFRDGLQRVPFPDDAGVRGDHHHDDVISSSSSLFYALRLFLCLSLSLSEERLIISLARLCGLPVVAINFWIFLEEEKKVEQRV